MKKVILLILLLNGNMAISQGIEITLDIIKKNKAMFKEFIGDINGIRKLKSTTIGKKITDSDFIKRKVEERGYTTNDLDNKIQCLTRFFQNKAETRTSIIKDFGTEEDIVILNQIFHKFDEQHGDNKQTLERVIHQETLHHFKLPADAQAEDVSKAITQKTETGTYSINDNDYNRRTMCSLFAVCYYDLITKNKK